MRGAVVTGAAVDIGAATACAFAQAGHALALPDRVARPEEVEPATLWRALPRASFVTGETLFVGSGLMRVH